MRASEAHDTDDEDSVSIWARVQASSMRNKLPRFESEFPLEPEPWAPSCPSTGPLGRDLGFDLTVLLTATNVFESAI